MVAAPGRALLLSFSRFDAVAYAAAGTLERPFAVYPEGAFRGRVFRLSGDGGHLVTGLRPFEAATLEVAEGYEGDVPTVWGDRLVTLWPPRTAPLRLFDGARS